jgi:hypothetical protein
MMMTGAEIVDRWSSLDGERSGIKSLVQQVLEYDLPRKSTVTIQRSEGQDLQRDLCDSTGETALERFASGMYTYMCPPGRPWRMLTPPIEYGRMSGDLAQPLLALNELLRDESGRSNFAEAAYEAFLDLGSAGLATLEPRRGIQSLLEYTAHPFEQIVFEEDARGRVDSVYRKFSLTARQAVQEFGLTNVGKEIREAFDSANAADRGKQFEFVHAALPRTEFTGGRLDVRNMAVSSQWVAGRDKTIVRTSGWPQQRYLVCRFAKASGEKHGRSPGMTGLPDVKMLNKIEETTIVGAENVVRPSILVPDGSFLGQIKLKPASLLYYRVNALNPSVKPEPFNMGAQVQLGEEYAESKRGIIARVFFNDLFQILDSRENETATAVRALMAERLNLLGPNFGRLKVEWFDPMTRIDLSILAGVPSLLRGLSLETLNFANVRYTSTLALAMEYAELTAMQDALLFLSPFAEIDPTVWDNFSFDEISREIAWKMCLPPRWLKSRSEVTALRAARAQYQAAQVQQQLALQQAAEQQKLTARPERGSPAEQMMAEAA